MSSYNIGVIYPSRGLLFTETLKEVLDNLTDSKALYEIYWSHGNKLPACFNKPLTKALKYSYCPNCSKASKSLTVNSNTDTIEPWNAIKKDAQNQDLSLEQKKDIHTSDDTAKNTIVNNVAEQGVKESEEKLIKTGMSLLDQENTDSSNLNTESLWQKNLVENSKSSRVSTTSTVLDTTTDQKTSSYGSEESDTDKGQRMSSAHTAKKHTCSKCGALKQPHTHILFLEDDMVIPKGTLKSMLKADEDVIACDYPIVNAPSGTVLYDQDDNAIFTGTGFMLCKRHIFDQMPRPIFRSDIEWTFKQYGDKVKFTATKVNPDKVYGHHDITFGLYQYLNNKPIKVHSQVLAQRKLKQKGENSTNNSIDEIILYDRYRKINFYMIEEDKVINDKDLLVQVELNGELVNVRKEIAQKLVKDYDAIKPTVLESGNIIIDINNNKKAINALRRIK